MQRNPWQRTALKLENLTDLQKFETWESVSVILLKQSSPYLPASPRITIKSKKRVLQITQEDWNKVCKIVFLNQLQNNLKLLESWKIF